MISDHFVDRCTVLAHRAPATENDNTKWNRGKKKSPDVSPSFTLSLSLVHSVLMFSGCIFSSVSLRSAQSLSHCSFHIADCRVTPYGYNFVPNPLIHRSDFISMYSFPSLSLSHSLVHIAIFRLKPRLRIPKINIERFCMQMHHLNILLTIYYPKMENKLE